MKAVIEPSFRAIYCSETEASHTQLIRSARRPGCHVVLLAWRPMSASRTGRPECVRGTPQAKNGSELSTASAARSRIVDRGNVSFFELETAPGCLRARSPFPNIKNVLARGHGYITFSGSYMIFPMKRRPGFPDRQSSIRFDSNYVSKLIGQNPTERYAPRGAAPARRERGHR